MSVLKRNGCPLSAEYALSASYEKFNGEYDAENWRLGIPGVLKDKEGKANINFEIQWREINKDHTIGFSVGIPFGKFVK